MAWLEASEVKVIEAVELESEASRDIQYLYPTRAPYDSGTAMDSLRKK
jgi:hypothetical protein